MKFNLGDRVYYENGGGKVAAVIVALDRKFESKGRYVIRFEDEKLWMGWNVEEGSVEHHDLGLKEDTRCIYWYALEDELLAIPPRKCRRVVIEITDNGASAEYIEGKQILKRERIFRYRDDAPDDGKAAVYSVAKLFGIDLNEMKKDEKSLSEMRDAWRKFKSVIEDKIFDNYGEDVYL